MKKTNRKQTKYQKDHGFPVYSTNWTRIKKDIVYNNVKEDSLLVDSHLN